MPELAEQWQTFGAPAPANEAVNPGWAGAMFYRPAGAGGPAANVYINGEYLASLSELVIHRICCSSICSSSSFA